MLSPFFSETAGGFFKTESTRTTMVWGDWGTPAKETAPSWLTGPEKIMLDCLARASGLLCPCGNPAAQGASKAVERTPARNLNDEFKGPTLTDAACAKSASRTQRNANIETLY